MTAGARFVSRIAGWMAVAVFAATAVFLAAIPRLYAVTAVDVPLERSTVVARDGYTRGILKDGVPAWRPHWTGRPPVAQLVNTDTGQVEASAVFSRNSLESNPAGILWTGDDNVALTNLQAEWKLPGEPASLRNRVLRFETVRLRMQASSVLAAGLAAGLLLWAVAIGCRLSSAVRLDANTIAGAAAPLVATAMALAAGWLRFMNPLWRSGDTDAATIAAFAAATAHGAAFTNDALLAAAAHFSWYTKLYVRLAIAARECGFDYDHAFAGVAFVSVLAGVLGAWRLLRKLSGSDLVGLVLAVTLFSISILYPANDNWMFGQALPRTMFAALAPWCILLWIRIVRRPALWCLAGAAAGLTTYVHPVSAPVLVAARALALLVSARPRAGRHLAALALFAAGALAALAPFAIRFARFTEARGNSAASAVTSIPAFLDIVRPSVVLHDAVTNPQLMLRVLIFGVAIWIAGRRFPVARRALLAAVAAVLIVGLVVPLADWSWATRAGRLPFEIELSRNLRYFEVIGVMALALAARALRRYRWRNVVAVLAFVLLYGGPLAESATGLATAASATVRAARGRLTPTAASRLEVLQFLQQPPRTFRRVWAPFDLDFLRAYEIPLAYTWKDPWALVVSDTRTMEEAIALNDLVADSYRSGFDPAAATRLLLGADADMAVLYRRDVSLALLSSPMVRFANERYVVVGPPHD
jgi:hypothetical protein